MRIKQAIALSIITSSVLFAAPIGSVQNQTTPPKEVLKKDNTPLVQIEGVQQTLKEYDTKGSKRYVKAFNITQNKNISTEELQDVVKEYANKELSFGEVKNIASKITKLYRDKGYFVARAYIPVQKILDNIIEIRIIEGEYGDFHLDNQSLIKDSMLQGFLKNTKIDGTLTTASIDKASLEKTLLLINDLPGVIISKADVKPGTKVGSSDFDVIASAQASYDGYMVADNYGSEYTGEERFMTGMNFNSPFMLGDKLSFTGLITKGEDLINGSIAYSMPIGYSGLMGSLSYSDTTYTLSKGFASLQAEGNSQSIEARLKYPIVRSRLENLYGSMSFEHNIIEDEIKSLDDVTDKSSNTVTFALDYDKSDVMYGLEHQLRSSVSLTLGHLKFDDKDKENIDKQASNTQGEFSKINLSISEDIYLTHNLMISASLAYQHSLGNKNLDGSEDFSIGGAYGVKVYPDGELSAENGYLFNIEAKYTLPHKNAFSNKIGLFYDRGKAYMADNNVGFEHRTLQDAGIGYYTTYKDFFANIQAAWRIDNEEVTSESNYTDRYLVMVGWSF